MNTQPPPLSPYSSGQRKTDDGHLRTLKICHYVMAGLSVLGIGFIGMHYAFMNMIFSNPEIMENARDAAFAENFFAVFKWFYLLGIVYAVALGIGNLFSAIFIKTRRNRVFSFIVSGLNCLNMPLGTLLGVFTIIVLSRPSVQDAYNAQSKTGTNTNSHG